MSDLFYLVIAIANFIFSFICYCVALMRSDLMLMSQANFHLILAMVTGNVIRRKKDD